MDSGHSVYPEVVNTEEKGRNEGIGITNLMAVDEKFQSLQGANLNVTMLGSVAEQSADQAEARQVLLSDCTNTLQSEHQAGMPRTQTVSKGQWKRMARIQGQQVIKNENLKKEHSGTMFRKREKEVVEEVQDLDSSITEKKQKHARKTQLLTTTEVEETSLSYSRPIR